MLNVEVKLTDQIQPACLLTDWFWCTPQPLEGGMIRPQRELTTQQVLPVVSKSVDSSQKLQTCGAVPTFGVAQSA